MTQVIIGNAAHPEYGVATIPFPILRRQVIKFQAPHF